MSFEMRVIEYGEYLNLEVIFRYFIDDGFDSDTIIDSTHHCIDITEIYDKDSDMPDENILYKFHDSEKIEIEKKIIKLLEEEFEYNIEPDDDYGENE